MFCCFFVDAGGVFFCFRCQFSRYSSRDRRWLVPFYPLSVRISLLFCAFWIFGDGVRPGLCGLFSFCEKRRGDSCRFFSQSVASFAPSCMKTICLCYVWKKHSPSHQMVTRNKKPPDIPIVSVNSIPVVFWFSLRLVVWNGLKRQWLDWKWLQVTMLETKVVDLAMIGITMVDMNTMKVVEIANEWNRIGWDDDDSIGNGWIGDD